MKTFSRERSDDKALIKSLVGVRHEAKGRRKVKPGHKKFEKVMHEFKEGRLHSGSEMGPKVKKLAQARAIAFSEDRRADKTAAKKKKKKK